MRHTPAPAEGGALGAVRRNREARPIRSGLVIGAGESTRSFVHTFLYSLGYSTTEVSSEKEILAAFGQDAFDRIVVDLLGSAAPGKRLAYASDNHEVLMWDVGLLERNGVLRSHTGYVYDIAFSPDGAILVSPAGAPVSNAPDSTPGPQPHPVTVPPSGFWAGIAKTRHLHRPRQTDTRAANARYGYK